MKVKIQSSRLVKPSYDGKPPSNTGYIPLSVFDTATFDVHIAIIYAYHPPTLPNKVLEVGLQNVLTEYREWAGRLGKNDKGDKVIFLNDKGVRFVEAYVDRTLDQATPFKPSPALLSLHPSLKDVEELMQVQLTRFSCGSLVIGFTSHHVIADGHATSTFMVKWGKSCRGLDINPLPSLHDRSIFVPRDPPCVEYEHRGVEFMSKSIMQEISNQDQDVDIMVHKVHFTKEFIAKLKAKASSSLNDQNKRYSTFVSLTAHLWKSITKARALNGREITVLRTPVNGRMRMDPPVRNEYFGNLVLWAFPSAKVNDLVQQPLSHAAKLIHEAVAKINNNYFKSFIDFASYKCEQEGLVPTADGKKTILCPSVQVDSWLNLPFYDLDFGGGSPFIFMPSYCPIEGSLFLLPSYIGDGSVDAFIPLLKENSASFRESCYCLD